MILPCTTNKVIVGAWWLHSHKCPRGSSPQPLRQLGANLPLVQTLDHLVAHAGMLAQPADVADPILDTKKKLCFHDSQGYSLKGNICDALAVPGLSCLVTCISFLEVDRE